MTIEIQTIPRRTLLGMKAPFIAARHEGANGPQVIGPLWDEMSKHYFGMQLNRAEWPLGIGVMWNADEDGSSGEMFYFAGYEVFDVPEDLGELEVLILEEEKYAYVTHIGPMSEMPQTVVSFYSDLLPNSQLQRRPGFDLEIYEEVGPTAKVVIAAPVN
jgi:AraC family transcriptional regulator